MADEQQSRDDLVTLSHKDSKIKGTFQTTRGALEDVYADKGWQIATEKDLQEADKIAAEQDTVTP